MPLATTDGLSLIIIRADRQYVNEDTALPLMGITVRDVDINEAGVTGRITVTAVAGMALCPLAGTMQRRSRGVLTRQTRIGRDFFS